jgi:hypothetical protein
VGDSATRLLITLGALRMVKSCRKNCPTAKVLLEVKARTFSIRTIASHWNKNEKNTGSLQLIRQLPNAQFV